MRISWSKNRTLNYIIEVLLIFAVLAIFLFMFFWPVYTRGSSMEPTIADGDMLIVSRILGRSSGRGSLVLAQVADGNIVKRLVALPGDHVYIQGYYVKINGAVFAVLPWAGANIDLVLGYDEHFLLGDNLGASIDSRHFGPISQRQISGRIILRYFPFRDFGIPE